MPCAKTFQIEPATDTSVFILQVFFEIARTVIDNLEMLRVQLPGKVELLPEIDEVQKWLQGPIAIGN